MHRLLINESTDKALAVGLLLILGLLVYVLFNHVYLYQLSAAREEISLLEKKNARVSSVLLREQELQQKIRQLRHNISRDKVFLNSRSSSQATSELQNFLKKLIATYTKSKILTIKPYPVMTHEDYQEALVEIRIRDISHRELHQLLFRIENNTPVFLVKELDIKRTQLRFKSVVKEQGNADKLEAILVVSGFFRGENT